MNLHTITLIHVLISLVGIVSGAFFAYGLLAEKSWPAWTKIFLATTLLTSLTGFLFPFHKVTPGIVIGVISVALLAVSLMAQYGFHLEKAWRTIFVITTLIAFYLNVFVLVFQSFEKIPFLEALAPHQSEPPFVIAQVVVLALFVAIITLAVKKARVGAMRAAV